MTAWLSPYREFVDDSVCVADAHCTAVGLALPQNQCMSIPDAVWAGHLPHHIGIDHTFFLAKKYNRKLTKQHVKDVVDSCIECQRVDPELLVNCDHHVS